MKRNRILVLIMALLLVFSSVIPVAAQTTRPDNQISRSVVKEFLEGYRNINRVRVYRNMEDDQLKESYTNVKFSLAQYDAMTKAEKNLPIVKLYANRLNEIKNIVLDREILSDDVSVQFAYLTHKHIKGQVDPKDPTVWNIENINNSPVGNYTYALKLEPTHPNATTEWLSFDMHKTGDIQATSKIKVTAEDGVTSQVYTVNIIKEIPRSSDYSVKDVKFAGNSYYKEINDKFYIKLPSGSKFEDYSIDDLEIIANDPNATVDNVVYYGPGYNKNMATGKFRIIAENNKWKDYYINVKVAEETIEPEADTQAPIITYNGDNPIVIVVDEELPRIEATAYDDIDGQVEVVHDGDTTVNSYKAGEYEITLRAQDKSGNLAEETIKVIVKSLADIYTPKVADTNIQLKLGDELPAASPTVADDASDAIDRTDTETYNDYRMEETVFYDVSQINMNEPGTYPAKIKVVFNDNSYHIVDIFVDVVGEEAPVDEGLTSGRYVLVDTNNQVPGVLDGTWVTRSDVAEDPYSMISSAMTLEIDGDQVKIKDANGVYLAPKGGNNNDIKEGEYSWLLVDNQDGTYSFKGQGKDTVEFANNTNHRGYRGYKNSTVVNTETYPTDFKVYKLEESQAPEDVQPEEQAQETQTSKQIQETEVTEEAQEQAQETQVPDEVQTQEVAQEQGLVSGKYILVDSDNMVPGTLNLGTGWVSRSELAEDPLSMTSSIMTLEVNEDKVKIKDSKGRYLAPIEGTKTDLVEGDYEWILIENGDGTYTFKVGGLVAKSLANHTNKKQGYQALYDALIARDGHPYKFKLIKVE